MKTERGIEQNPRPVRRRAAGRVIIAGLDSVSWDIVDRVAEAMPELSRMRREGASGVLTSTLPPITPVAWTSLVTGVGPGRHGVYEFVHRAPDGTWHPVTRRLVRAPALDERLEAAGRASVLVNLPVSYPGRSAAIRLQDFLSPDPSPVDPPELLEAFPEIRAYRPFYAGGPIASRTVSQMVAEVSDLERRRFTAARAILEHRPWQFLFYGVTGTDHLHHRALHEMLGPSGPSPAILAFYREVDETLAWLADHLGPDDLLIVASDHGSAVLEREFYLNSYLVAEGFAVWESDREGASRERAVAWEAARARLWGAAREAAFRLGIDARTRSVRMRLGLRMPGAAASARVDERRSRAFMPHAFAWPAVYVREGECAALADRLRSVVDPVTERPVFAAVWTADEVYGRERAPGAPDLVLLPAPGVSVHPGRSSAHFRTVTKNHHKREGMVLLYGGAARGLPRDLGTRAIEDVAPTVLDAFGLPIPAVLEGRTMLAGRPPQQVREAVRRALAGLAAQAPGVRPIARAGAERGP